MEPEQCFGVVCELGVVPGAPETWIVSGPADWDTGTPGIQSTSRNVSFTYMGEDEFTPIHELVFECRIDSTNPLAWEDCEYPAEYLNLSPGEHTFEVRAIDMMGQGLADPTPAAFTWTYEPLPTGVAPEVTLDVVPDAGRDRTCLDAIFTFHANEPDVTFQCKVDANGYEPCGFESATFMNQGAFEWGLEPRRGRPAHLLRPRDRLRGQRRAPDDLHVGAHGRQRRLHRRPRLHARGRRPAGRPGDGRPEREHVGRDPLRGQRRATPCSGAGSTAWTRAATSRASRRSAPARRSPADTAFPDPLLPGDHVLEVYGESELMGSAAELEPAVYEWEVVDPVDTLPPKTPIERAPGAADLSSTVFEFSGIDDLTPEFLLTFECQVTPGTAPPNGNEWVDCISPFNLLDVYSYADPQLLLTEHTFYVRAVDMSEPEFPDPTQPEFEGNPDPTPASYTWTPVADTRDPAVTISGGPANGATVGQEPAPYTFSGVDNATPLAPARVRVRRVPHAAGIGSAEWESCESPVGGGYDISGLEPGAYTVAVRATDLAGNIGAAAHADRHGRRGARRHVPQRPGRPARSRLGRARRRQRHRERRLHVRGGPARVDVRVLGRRLRLPALRRDVCPGHATRPGSSRTASTSSRSARRTPQGIVGEEAVYEWFVALGAGRHRAELAVRHRAGERHAAPGGHLHLHRHRQPDAGGRAHLRVRAGLDDVVELVHLAGAVLRPDPRHAHAAAARGRRRRQHRVDAGRVHVDGRAAAGRDDPLRPGCRAGGDDRLDRDVHVLGRHRPVTFHCWLDGRFNPHAPGDPSQPAPCDPAGQTYTDLGIGEHLFAVRAVDEFGNIGVWEDTEFRRHAVRSPDHVGPGERDEHDGDVRVHERPVRPRRGRSTARSTTARSGSAESPKTYKNLWPGRAHVPGADAVHGRRLDGPAVRARPDPGRAHVDGRRTSRPRRPSSTSGRRRPR